MKKYSLAILTILLFAGGLILGFLHGTVPSQFSAPAAGTIIGTDAATQVVYTGPAAILAKFFVSVFNGILAVVNGNALFAIMLLALVVELVLLYPSVAIQMKQKKIHTFHKKLVDRFQKGELTYSKTKQELDRLYDVNERIHKRGALLVITQIIVFLSVLWGLNLLAQASYLIDGKWDLFNASLLGRPEGIGIPLIASLLFFLHGITKIYYKEREDYISPLQTGVSLAITILGSVVVYFFSSSFAVALTLYFVTLMAFGTLRYIVVEQSAKQWGRAASAELRKMLKEAKPHKDKFEYLSRKWNHLPVVRHLNFHLLEEALSMTLGLILALNFFGAIQEDGTQISLVPKVAVASEPINAVGGQPCTADPSTAINTLNAAGDISTWADSDYFWIFGIPKIYPNEAEYVTISKTTDAAPSSICIPGSAGGIFTVDHEAVQNLGCSSLGSNSEGVDRVSTVLGVTSDQAASLYQCGYRATQIASTGCSDSLRLRAPRGQNIATGAGAVDYTIYNKTVYRLYIENTTVFGQFDYALTDTDSIIASDSSKDNYVQFTVNETKNTGAASLSIWDSNNGEECGFDISLNLAGQGVRKITPTYVNVGL